MRLAGGPAAKPEEPLLGPRIPVKPMSPKDWQYIAERNAKIAREKMLIGGTDAFMDDFGSSQKQTASYVKASEIKKSYLQKIEKEIELTGKIGDARQHASQIIDIQNKLEEAGIEKTIAGKNAIKELDAALTKLEGKQQWARIAEDIGSAFADAFTDMIFEAKKFADVMKSLMKSIAQSVIQNMITTPMAQSITLALGGTVPGLVKHGGGIVGNGGGMRRVPAMAFAGAPRLHGGLMGDEFPAILQRGESVIPKGGGGASPTIIINNNTGQQMRQDGPAQFNGKDMIIQIVADDYQSGGQLRKMFQG